MRQTRLVPRLFACLLLASAQFAVVCVAQTPHAPAPDSTVSAETERGIKLYKSGDDAGAVKVLRAVVKQAKTDADAWYYLGLAQTRAGKLKDARKAFETTVKLRPLHAASHSALAYNHLVRGKLNDAEKEAARSLQLDAKDINGHLITGIVNLRKGSLKKALASADDALQINADFAPAYLLKSQALVELFGRASNALSDEARGAMPLEAETVKELREMRPAYLREAADNLDKYLRLTPNDPERETWREQLETLRFYTRPATGAGMPNPVHTARDVTRKAVILSKPEPSFTEEAREELIVGTVRIRLVLAADGKVRHLLVLRSLPYGLTQEAIKAARRIKFIPAMKNGIPVSQFATVEYNFNIF